MFEFMIKALSVWTKGQSSLVSRGKSNRFDFLFKDKYAENAVLINREKNPHKYYPFSNVIT